MFFPKNAERIWWIGKRRVQVTLHRGVQPHPESGQEWKAAPPSNLKGAPSAPVPGGQGSTFLFYGAEEAASWLCPNAGTSSPSPASEAVAVAQWLSVQL